MSIQPEVIYPVEESMKVYGIRVIKIIIRKENVSSSCNMKYTTNYPGSHYLKKNSRHKLSISPWQVLIGLVDTL